MSNRSADLHTLSLPKTRTRPTVTFTNEEECILSPPTKPVPIAMGNLQEDHDTPLSLKQENPQEANSPPTASEDLPFSTREQLSSPITSRRKRRQIEGWKRRIRGRPVRLAKVSHDSMSTNESKNCIPSSQYETTFRRRAIRKEENAAISASSPARGIFGSNARSTRREAKSAMDGMPGYDEEIGDTSLGMKLNILGGRVIVQTINPLADGRASPAQLTGLVRRGDVLIAIDGKSIVNLPLDQLVVGLQPLSTPHEDGSYKRVLKLRFLAGEGLEALERNDETLSKTAGETGVFSLTQFLPQEFPMVDQLSGQPMFDDAATSPQGQKWLKPVVATALKQTTDGDHEKLVKDRGSRKSLSLNELISLSIADLMQNEKAYYISEFFSWNEEYSELLRPSIVATIRASEEITAFLKKKKQLMERGEEAMKGAKALSLSIEDIDKGKDLRSFQAWSSNASLRSRASTRRRYVMEAASVVASTIVEEVESDVAVSVGSGELDDQDGFDGDELLLQLAAHDEIWRRQVLETIDIATTEMQEADKGEEENTAIMQEMDIAEKLGSLFLGDQVNKLLTKKKKSYALPQGEVTSVLFDLVTHLASTTPDEISVKGKFEINPQTSLVPFRRSKNSTVEKDALLATLFIVNDVFPAWLKCFRPLPWEERRVLWPHTKASNSSNSVAASVADDLLTIDSPGASPEPLRKKKNLRETIEDMELDVESRAETCFLISFYFTQEILPGMVENGGGWRNTKSSTETDALAFVDLYGAYLKLPMALAYASFLRSESVVAKLLELAKHDPRHLEALKDISKVNSLVLYEPTMLSAIIKQVLAIGHQKLAGRSHLIHLAVSAFPDLRPWLVRQGCMEGAGDGSTQGKDLEELYYLYLSLLLHPSDGHEAARQDVDLVKEWCYLSVQGEGHCTAYNRNKMINFHLVASRKQPDFRMFRRDLPYLMNLAFQTDEIELTLDLMNEMLEYKLFVLDEELMTKISSNLREIATKAIAGSSSNVTLNTTHLKRSFILFEKIASSQERFGVNELLSVPREYENLIVAAGSKCRQEFLKLLAFNADTRCTLQALSSWNREHMMSGTYFLPVLQQTLERSATLKNRKELSPSLIRLEKARTLNLSPTQYDENHSDELRDSKGMLWMQLANGALRIDK